MKRRSAVTSLQATVDLLLVNKKTMTAEVAILRAYALASQHRCSEAERMLGSVPDAIRSPSGADLLARIKFEQGDIDSARRIWEEVIRIQPDNEPAKKALECIDAPLLTKRLWGFCSGQKWTWLAIMAVLMGVSFSVGKALRSNGEQFQLSKRKPCRM